MTLDTPATLKALARTNDIAKARRLAINAIEREALHLIDTIAGPLA